MSAVNHFTFQSETRAQALSKRSPFRREMKCLRPKTATQRGINWAPSDTQHNKGPVGKTSCYCAIACWAIQQHLSFFFSPLSAALVRCSLRSGSRRAALHSAGDGRRAALWWERDCVRGLGAESWETGEEEASDNSRVHVTSTSIGLIDYSKALEAPTHPPHRCLPWG